MHRQRAHSTFSLPEFLELPEPAPDQGRARSKTLFTYPPRQPDPSPPSSSRFRLQLPKNNMLKSVKSFFQKMKRGSGGGKDNGKDNSPEERRGRAGSMVIHENVDPLAYKPTFMPAGQPALSRGPPSYPQHSHSQPQLKAPSPLPVHQRGPEPHPQNQTIIDTSPILSTPHLSSQRSQQQQQQQRQQAGQQPFPDIPSLPHRPSLRRSASFDVSSSVVSSSISPNRPPSIASTTCSSSVSITHQLDMKMDKLNGVFLKIRAAQMEKMASIEGGGSPNGRVADNSTEGNVNTPYERKHTTPAALSSKSSPSLKLIVGRKSVDRYASEMQPMHMMYTSRSQQYHQQPQYQQTITPPLSPIDEPPHDEVGLPGEDSQPDTQPDTHHNHRPHPPQPRSRSPTSPAPSVTSTLTYTDRRISAVSGLSTASSSSTAVSTSPSPTSPSSLPTPSTLKTVVDEEEEDIMLKKMAAYVPYGVGKRRTGGEATAKRQAAGGDRGLDDLFDDLSYLSLDELVGKYQRVRPVFR
ncbi:hypothetical protein HDV00_002312 [Rhizophlyctis rosea]|nr:hypothetical protein HDV00_002312 [Rhizophlyctis rosea]